MKQPSPCCAAAAVAGAWNALGGMDRSHPNALRHTDVVHIYIQILSEQIDRLKQSFERKLGAGPIDLLISAVSDHLSRAAAIAAAKNATNKKEKKISRVAVAKAAKAAVKDFIAAYTPPQIDETQSFADNPPMAPHPLYLLSEIIATETAAMDVPDTVSVCFPLFLYESYFPNCFLMFSLHNIRMDLMF